MGIEKDLADGDIFTWVAVVGIFICIFIVLIANYFTPEIPKPKPTPIKVNLTKTGESVGKGIGRLGIGFVKGIFKSGDGK